MRANRLLGLALAWTAALVVPAIAQAGPDDDKIHEMRQAIGSALNNALEHEHSDRPTPWNGPSGYNGSIIVYPSIVREQRLCRPFKYIVRDTTTEVVDSGLRCRESGGLWLPSGTPDNLDANDLRPPMPMVPSPFAPRPDPRLAQLQRNLMRLAYDRGPADGLPRPDLDEALREFDADEGVPRDPDALQRDLALSEAAVARSARGGSCEPSAAGAAPPQVCGRRN